MNQSRQIIGKLMALVLAAVGLALMAAAWRGWVTQFGWPWAVVALVLSLFSRFNAYAVVGAFFFAQHELKWPLPHCIALASVGLLYLTPGIMQHVAELLTGRDLNSR